MSGGDLVGYPLVIGNEQEIGNTGQKRQEQLNET